MIYICADDYGLCKAVSRHIDECVGTLNKISVFPNFDTDISALEGKAVNLSLHLNLVEGKCIADPSRIPILADEHGNFRYSFVGLYFKSLTQKKAFVSQVYEEIKSQIILWQSKVGEGVSIMIDSHQHTHMIPGVFEALVKAIEDVGVDVKYLRIPAEPILPFVMTPSLYFTYSPANIIKQWLLKILWQVNKKIYNKHKFPSACFFGILFSGGMDSHRVSKILPRILDTAAKKGRDTEILFHPGYMDEELPEDRNIVFDKFYLSAGRKTEFDTLNKINFKKEGGINAIH